MLVDNWNYWREWVKILKGYCPRPITHTCTLTELWIFLNLWISTLSSTPGSCLTNKHWMVKQAVLLTALVIFQLIWYKRYNIFISQLLQALANYRNGSTGQLSAITVGLIFGGSVIRIFTSIQETGDQLVVITYMCAATCNAILVGQMIYYASKKKQE
jgi:hypothetical protein